MKFIKPSVELLDITQNALQKIEAAGRTCYKSEHKITDDSAEKFCEMIQSRNHMSVIEHAYASFRIITSRDITHELVRHRLASYSEESTRYVNHQGKEMEFIQPYWIPDGCLKKCYDYSFGVGAEKIPEEEWDILTELEHAVIAFIFCCNDAEVAYNDAIKYWGLKPQDARCMLPGTLKSEIVMTANFREWKHFIEMRCSNAAHPDMRIIAGQIKQILHDKYPVIF